MVRVISIFLLFFLISGCGTSTETTNSFTVSISGNSISGSRLYETRVGVYPVDYNPVDSTTGDPDTVTVADGNLNLSGVKQGYYNILIQKISEDYGYCIQNVFIGTGALQRFSDTLKPTGGVFGSLSFEVPANVEAIIAIVEGTPFSDTIRTGREFTINQIPEGRYKLIFRLLKQNILLTNSTLNAKYVEVHAGLETAWIQ
jgi:hypothetical protein